MFPCQILISRWGYVVQNVYELSVFAILQCTVLLRLKMIQKKRFFIHPYRKNSRRVPEHVINQEKVNSEGQESFRRAE